MVLEGKATLKYRLPGAPIADVTTKKLSRKSSVTLPSGVVHQVTHTGTRTRSLALALTLTSLAVALTLT